MSTIAKDTAALAKAAQPARKARAAATAPTPKPKPKPKPKLAPKAVVKPVAPAPAAAGGKQKQKLVRDSFTIPKDEYNVLVGLKQRAGQLAHHAKKSEILRAGVQMLASLPDARFLAALAAVPSLKTGRPKQEPVAPADASVKKSSR